MHKIITDKLLRFFAYTFVLTLLASCSNTLIAPSVSGKASVKRIVLISIDGLRPDAINSKNAKNLYALSHAGLYFPNAQTIKRSVTLPSHTSMLTGLDVKRHKITKNKPLPSYIKYPTVMQILKKHGKTTAALFSKEKLKYLFPPDSHNYLYGRGHNGIDYNQTRAANVAAEFSRVWTTQDYSLSFIHIREPDSAGHKHGWMSDEYLNQAVTTADEAVGHIYNLIKNSRYADNTLLIVTSDHGGKDTTHWHQRPEDLSIPLMVVHPAISPELRTDSDVSIYDITPTILYLLDTPAPKGLDGRIIERIKTLFSADAL